MNCRVILATRHFLVMEIISSSLINSIVITLYSINLLLYLFFNLIVINYITIINKSES